MSKTPFIIHDFLLLDEICNIACDYCEGFYNDGIPFQRKDERLIMPEKWNAGIRKRPELEVLGENPTIDDLFKNADVALRKIEAETDIPILKVSGGEIYVVDEIEALIKNLAKRYERVQILTNATKLTPARIGLLKDIGNVHLQISLDGHTTESNYARVQNPRLTEHMLSMIGEAHAVGIPVEVNCVLTNHNGGAMDEFLKYLEKYDDVVLLPRPVRGAPAKVMHPTPEQIVAFDRFVEKYSSGHKNLPPPKFLEHVLYALQNRGRSRGCYTPFTVLGSSYLGRVDTCTCGGHLPTVGDSLKDARAAIAIKTTIAHFPPDSAIAQCGNCVTNYEVMDLYIDGEIDANELRRMPLYDSNKVVSNLDLIKGRVKK